MVTKEEIIEEKIKKYSWKNLFFIFFILWNIDFILTIILLNFREGFYEANFISAFLYSLGVIGYMINFIFCMLIIFLLSFLVTKLVNRLKGEKYKRTMHYIIIILFILIEGMVILNNLWRLI